MSDTGYVPRPRSSPRVLLRRLREIMAEESEPQSRLEQLVRAIASNMVADVCSLYVKRTSGALELFATVGLNPEAVHETRLGPGEGLVGIVADTRKPLVVQDAPSHPGFVYRAETGEDPLFAFLGVPIVRSGEVLGVLVVQNRTKRRYTQDEVEAAQIVATIFAEIVRAGELLDEADTQEARQLLEAPREGKGAAVSPGIAMGTVALLEPDSRTHKVFAASVAAEKTRLDTAVADLRESVDGMIARGNAFSGISQEVLEVYRLFAYDRGWIRRIEEKVLSGLTAETAVEQVQADNRERMRAAPDPYLRERLHDLDDLSRRLIRALRGEEGVPELPDNAIVMADTLGPAELLELDRSKLAGLVLSEGGGTSHAAIVARSLDLPFVSGVPALVEAARPGDSVIVDGDLGHVHLRPPADVVHSFEEKKRLREKRRAAYAALKDEPSRTMDGVLIELQMNAGLLLDMPHLEETGASGIGLFRTELPFLLGNTLPTAKDQEALYREVMDAAGGKPVVFRTADIGSDKRANYMNHPVEVNPAMGWRGLRIGLDREGLLRTQIRAMIAAAAGRELHLLLPLVTRPEEVVAARGVIEKELSRRERVGGALPARVRLGAMLESPAAAWCARDMAAVADFLSIGGNDLAQFFFAADRDCEQVASRYDPLSRDFLSFVRHAIKEAEAGGKPLSYCGEQASDPLMALALSALGLKSLSVTASAIGPLKAMFLSLDMAPLQAWLDERMAVPDGNLRQDLGTWAREQGVVMPAWSGEG